jgi:WD40 repeat protein
MRMHINFLALGATLIGIVAAQGQPASLGIFAKDADIGHPGKAGSAAYFSDQGRYVITGGGANMWFTNDACHFVWKEMRGDVSLSAAIKWVTPTGVDHRKACLVIRQGLEPDAAYADAVVHGNGLTSLQFRAAKGVATHEIAALVSSPAKIRIEKHGDYVSMSVAAEHGEWQPAGGSFRMTFTEPLYVGLAVCAHDDNAAQECAFADVELNSLPPARGPATKVTSTLEYISMRDLDRHVMFQTTDRIEAPNWSADGQFIVFNSGGRLYKLPLGGATPRVVDTPAYVSSENVGTVASSPAKAIDTGIATHCNNDHGFSPDGTQIAFSDSTEIGKSVVYVMPFASASPTRLTAQGPSYWHGWSPDGKTLAFCGQRNGEFDIYTIPVEGGNETRLTTAPGLDDGPDYSPDGKYIYFNSERTGLMQIWRMNPDGSDQRQFTGEPFNDWFPHPSPDGRWICFLRFPKEVTGHPANQDVTLCLIDSGGVSIRVLTTLFGGQGTINVPSWSPDSGRIAFVSYQPVQSASQARP